MAQVTTFYCFRKTAVAQPGLALVSRYFTYSKMPYWKRVLLEPGERLKWAHKYPPSQNRMAYFFWCKVSIKQSPVTWETNSLCCDVIGSLMYVTTKSQCFLIGGKKKFFLTSLFSKIPFQKSLIKFEQSSPSNMGMSSPSLMLAISFATALVLWTHL